MCSQHLHSLIKLTKILGMFLLLKIKNSKGKHIKEELYKPWFTNVVVMKFIWLYCSWHDLSLLNWLKLKLFLIPWKNWEFSRRIGIELANLIIIAYNFFIVIVLTYWNLHKYSCHHSTYTIFQIDEVMTHETTNCKWSFFLIILI
jgi:hypothetical protein